MRAGEFYPPEGHDFTPTDEIRKMAIENQLGLEANYSDRLAVFRADVILKLMKHNALDNGFGWALFDVDLNGDNSGLGYLDDRLNVFISLRQVCNNGRSIAPTIRLITNQFTRIDGGVAVITDDITVDNAGSSQYFTDVAILEEGSFGEKGTQSVFIVPNENNGLNLANYKNLTPITGFGNPDTPGARSTVLPFGHFTCFEDKLYALEKASGILTQVKDLQPQLQNTTSS